jgi:hypothetical protein
MLISTSGQPYQDSRVDQRRPPGRPSENVVPPQVAVQQDRSSRRDQVGQALAEPLDSLDVACRERMTDLRLLQEPLHPMLSEETVAVGVPRVALRQTAQPVVM